MELTILALNFLGKIIREKFVLLGLLKVEEQPSDKWWAESEVCTKFDCLDSYTYKVTFRIGHLFLFFLKQVKMRGK